MEQIVYEGESYRRVNSKWVDSSNLVACESIQKILNRRYLETLDVSSYSIEELVAEGDRLKESTSYQAAITFYEKAAESCDEQTLAYILPRITACYRKCNMARSAIDLFSFAKSRYGSAMMSHALLTSAAAAYCDLKEYENALRCCRRAYKHLNGQYNSNLSAVWGRIKKESGLE